jgi:ketosteroid isomerase-like protein
VAADNGGVSQADVDVVLDQFAAVNERDFARAMDHYADDVVLVVPAAGVKGGRFEGKAAVGEWFGDWFRTFGQDYHFEITEARELSAGGPIFLHARHGATARLSGIKVHDENSYLYRVRDGKVSRVGFFVSREEALEAANTQEWASS